MKRLLLVALLLAGLPALWAQQPDDADLFDRFRTDARFEDLIDADDWALVSREEDRWHLRLLTDREKRRLEEMVRRWQEGQDEFERKVADIRPEINLLEDRLRILTGFARSFAERVQRIRGEDPRNAQTAQEREQTEQRLAQLKEQLAEIERENQPPMYMGTRWRSADFSRVVELGRDYVGLQRDDSVTYYRLADIGVIQRPVAGRDLDQPRLR